LGFFYAENASQACLNERMRHKKTNATKGCVKRLCASSMRKGRRRNEVKPTIPDMKYIGRRRSVTKPTIPDIKCFGRRRSATEPTIPDLNIIIATYNYLITPSLIANLYNPIEVVTSSL
jgi:hypothetical protein